MVCVILDDWRFFMKKGKVIIAVIASLASAALISAAALIICSKLLDKKYFTVSE